MNSKLLLFTAIKNRLLELTELPTVKRWNNQITPDNEDIEEPIEYDAAFIQMAEIDWETKLGGVQEGDILITIRYAFNRLNTEDEQFYTVLSLAHQKLQGLESTIFTALNRVAEREDNDHDNCIVWEADYQTNLQDCDGEDTAELIETAITELNLILTLKIDDIVIRTGK